MRQMRSEQIITDLLRSSWVIEQGRAEVFERRGQPESHDRARAQADILARHLERRSVAVDEDLAHGHAAWIENVVGSSSEEEPLGELFLCRLSDWVLAHASPFIGNDGDRLGELAEEERSGLAFPSELPPAPPFQPLETRAVEAPGPVRIRFAILSDAHFGSRNAERAVRAAIREINASGAELVIQLGDLTDGGDPEQFEQARDVLSELEPPLVTMMGNHDVYSFREERLAGRELYSATFGREPEGIIVEQSGVQFGVLDSVEHETSPFASFDLLTGTLGEGPGGGIVRGTLTPAQHDLLADLAAPDAGPAFIFLHHPVQPFTGFPPVVFGLRDEDSGRLHATCDSGNVWGVFAGHTHRNARTRMFDGVPAHEVAIPRDFPFGYALVDVSDRGYAYRFIQISDEQFLKRGYARTGAMQRRYALGTDEERGFCVVR